MALGYHEPEAELRELGLEPRAHGEMPRPRRLESLVEHRAERGVQREDHGDGCGVVVHARRAGNVVGDQREVEVPRLRRSIARLQAGDGAVGERER